MALFYVVLPVLQMDAGWVRDVDHVFHDAHPLRGMWNTVRPFVSTLPTRPSIEDMRVYARLCELSSDLSAEGKAAYMDAFVQLAGVGTPYACPGSWFDRAIPHSRLRA